MQVQVSEDSPPASQKQGDDNLNPSEYLAKHVYPVLEPAIVDLLKAAFPADFKEFVRRASVAAEESQLLEFQNLQQEKMTHEKDQAAEGAEPPVEEDKEKKPAESAADKLLSPEIKRRASTVSQPPVRITTSVPVSKANLRPVLWLAQYLKERNKQNTAEREEAKRNSALELASQPAEDIETVHANLIASVKQLLWPCSVYIATRDKLIEQVPKPEEPDAAKPADGEEGEEEAEAEAEEEEEDGEEKAPKEPEMMDVEVPILRYIACSHPNKDTIAGRLLRLDDDACLSGRALRSRQPLCVPDVATEPALTFFPPEPEIRAGSFVAVSFTRTPEDAEPYAVLSIDTLLDRRKLTDADVDMMHRLARAAEAVAHTVPLPPPPPVEEPPAEEDGAAEGEGEDEQDAEEEG